MNNAFSEDPTRPDFILCGGPDDKGGVWLLASRALTDARLRVEPQLPDLLKIAPKFRLNTRVWLTSELLDAVEIQAPSYPEALQALAKLWNNKWSSREEIKGQKEIEQ
jgi:hypothetical protein